MRENIRFNNKEVVLDGMLIKPDTRGRHPVVIVAHTSSAGERGFSVYQQLADNLLPLGVAVFVYDRRGSGKSTGSFESATFYDLAADLQAAVDCLKLRSELDPRHIGVWGMSQGGWIAPLAASLSSDIAFVITISAVGVSPAEQMDYSAAFELRRKVSLKKRSGRCWRCAPWSTAITVERPTDLRSS